MTTTRIIVRADDAGLCAGVNRAIAETVRDGIVGNVSVMAPAPAFADAAARLRVLDGVCLGLHVTLTSEWMSPRWGPVLPPHEVPSLVAADGTFPETTVDLYHQEPVTAEVAREVRAQLGYARTAGLQISYLDEHMGVGWIPGLRDQLIEIARAENLVWAGDIAVLAPTAPGPDPGRTLLDQLHARPAGTYVLITHPGYDDAELRRVHERTGQPGAVAAARDAERRALISPEAHQLTSELELVRYGDTTGERSLA
jgi:chitin disaccharide deacetylase